MKIVAVNLAVLAGLAALLVGGAELWLRLSIPSSSGESIYMYTPTTPRYKLMKPDSAVLSWGKTLRTNELGFRDAPVAPKQPGELRIVVLGDSFTVSAGVDFAAIWTSRLQQALRKAHPEVRVVNLAVGGYNIVQYELVLQEVGLGLRPDLLLVALFPDNDFSMETYEANRRVAQGLEPPEPRLPWWQALYVYRAWGGRVEARVRKWLSRPAPAAASGHQAGWERNVAALRAIADTARRERLPLAVALLPHTWHFERQRPLFGRVERVCGELELRCVNLLEPLIARRVPEASLRLNAIDAHPNERYNALVAEELTLPLAGLLGAAAAKGPTAQ